MIPVTQSRTGEHGTCFRASLASILNLKEKQVPDFGEANEDPGIDTFLAKYGLRYQEVPIGNTAPVGYHIITGISPRGGMHAVVGRDGQIVWDPHPLDGTPHGLTTQEKYGLLLPAGAKDSRVEAEGLRQRHDELKNSPVRHSGGEPAYRALRQPTTELVKEAEHLLAKTRTDDQPFWAAKVASAHKYLVTADKNAGLHNWGQAAAHLDAALTMSHTVIDKLRHTGRAKDGFFTTRLDRYPMEQLLDTLGIDIKEFLRRSVVQRERLIDTAIRELDKKTGRAKDAMDIRAMYEAAKTPMDISAATRAYNKLMDANQEPFGAGTMAALKKTAQERVASSNVHQSTGKEISTNMKMHTTARRPNLFRGGRDSDPRDGITKCQACGVGLMGDDVLERSGKVICPECADASVRKARDLKPMTNGVYDPEKSRFNSMLMDRSSAKRSGIGYWTGKQEEELQELAKKLGAKVPGKAHDRSRAKDGSYSDERLKSLRAQYNFEKKAWPNQTPQVPSDCQLVKGVLQWKPGMAPKLVSHAHFYAKDRSRLHRALDAVMDSRGARARDGEERDTADEWMKEIMSIYKAATKNSNKYGAFKPADQFKLNHACVEYSAAYVRVPVAERAGLRNPIAIKREFYRK